MIRPQRIAISASLTALHPLNTSLSFLNCAGHEMPPRYSASRNGLVMKTTHLAILVICCAPGCSQSLINTSVMEKRVIQQFADAVTEENETALRNITSGRFEEKAMSSDDALTDLRAVDLPSGELSVVEVKKTDASRRDVVVKEDSGGKYQFQLIHDNNKGYWVVDDVLTRQTRKGTRSTRSTTEVMDLIKTLRTFLSVWESGSREEILAMTSPDLSRSLNQMPDNWLKALTAGVASAYEDGMARKPEANLTDGEAVVKLPARNGHLMMKIVRGPDNWLVDDVEVHNRRDDNHPGSVRRQADAINSVNAFLAAYGKHDRETLEFLSSEDLFESSLKAADLTLVTLPSPTDFADDYVIRAYESRLTVMIPAGKEVVRLDLKEREDSTVASASEFPEDPAERFIIESVMLYDRTTQKQRSLSSVFTAPTRASAFLKALTDRDHRILTHISSQEFSRGTWERVTPEILPSLSIPDLYGDGLTLDEAHTMADITELQFTNSRGMLISCRMVTQNGNLRVDDVQYPNDHGQITSLRTQLELRVPLLEFASAWSAEDLKLLQKSCSADFNRLVWSHVAEVPGYFPGLPEGLRTPITNTQVTQERATVHLSSATGMKNLVASLITEHDYWVIDELRYEESPGRVVGIRQKLRGEIAARLLSGSYSMVHSAQGADRVVPIREEPPAPSPIQQASATFPAQHSGGVINNAIYRKPAEHDSVPEANPIRTAVHTVETDPAAASLRFAEPSMKSPETSAVRSVSRTIPRSNSTPANTGAATAKTDSGLTVFGPGAAEVARSLNNPQSRKGFDLTTPIDMTEDVPSGEARSRISADQNAPSAQPPSGEGMLYFGPDRNILQSNQSSVPAAKVSEPADAPISID